MTKIQKFLKEYQTGTTCLPRIRSERDKKLRVYQGTTTLIVRQNQRYTTHGWVRVPSIELQEIEVSRDKRERGLGDRALCWLCRLADKHRLSIVLEASPFANKSGVDPDTAGLIHWYKKHGFLVEEWSFMRRKPTKVTKKRRWQQ